MLGYSADARGRHRGSIHRIADTAPAVRPGIVLATWECSPRAIYRETVLVDEVPEGRTACVQCDVYGLQKYPEVVYLADLGDAYKVGTTTSLTVRLAALKGHLVRAIRGSYAEERFIVQEMAGHRVRGREHLERSPEVLGAVMGWMDAFEAPEAAWCA